MARAKKMFPSRSQAIQEAVVEKLERIERSRLARVFGELRAWPEY